MIPSADPRRFAEIERSVLTRAGCFGCASLPFGIFSILWLLLCIPAIRRTTDPMTRLAGVLVTVFGTGTAFVVIAVFIWRAVVNLRARTRLAAIHQAMFRGRGETVEDLVRATGLSRADVDLGVRDGYARGLFALPGTMDRPAPRIGAPVVRDDAWIGRTVRGAYRLEAALGRGGMGAVFRARHLPSGTPCAFKILLASRYDAPELMKRFEREATLSRRVVHPSLVRVLDFGVTEEGAPYIVMELLDGETLGDRLGRMGTLPLAEALAITRAIGDGLSAAHAVGFLHRDIKPSNIVIARGASESRPERPVLIDFGLAKRIEGLAPGSRVTSTGVVVGTPLYLSPEQARGEPLDARSDVYALAIVLHEMITGVPPFFDKTLAELHARLLGEGSPLLEPDPMIPPAIGAALARALAPRRDDRFGSVAELLAALAS